MNEIIKNKECVFPFKVEFFLRNTIRYYKVEKESILIF